MVGDISFKNVDIGLALGEFEEFGGCLLAPDEGEHSIALGLA